MADESLEEADLSSARSFRTILSSTSPSESPSPSSFSSTTSGEPTFESDGDSREKIAVDEGIYGWICSLIEEREVARFLDRASGIYELDWQEVIEKYWFEWRSGRKGIKNDTAFDPRTVSNTLRGALLNAYKDRGAKEFTERKVMDRRNKTIKRSFRLPWAVTEKQRRKLDHDSTRQVVKARTSVRTEPSSKPSNSSGDRAVPSVKPLSPLVPHAESPLSLSSLDPRFLAVDEEESEGLIEYFLFENSNDEQNITNFPPTATTATTNQGTANSSGYESSLALPQNMVQEMDPCEGPYQVDELLNSFPKNGHTAWFDPQMKKGGNKSYIFLACPFHSLAPGADKKCKVTFGSSIDGFHFPCEVMGTVKNPYTIQVTIPHCPKLLGEQLASSRVTVAVIVESWEGVYVGETEYTYNVNLQERFENYVKALDDEHMETEFTDASEQTLLLRHNRSDFSGSNVFNYSTFHVLVLVAVKHKAERFLASFLKSSVAFSVCRQLQQQLSTLVDTRKDKIPNKIAGFIRDMCQRLSLENNEKDGTLEPGQCEENREQLKKTDEGYDGGSETNYERELMSCSCLVESLKLGNTIAKGEEKLANRLCQPVDDTVKKAAFHGHHSNRCEQVEPCNFCVCRINRTADQGKRLQETKTSDVDVNGGLSTTRIFVVRKPCSPVPVSRSKGGFPDPRTDVFVELQVRKEPKDGDDKASHCEHVTIGRQGENYVTVNVKHFGTEQSAKDWQLKYVKRPSGKIGYWFRFYEPSCELLLVFSLCNKHQAMHPELKHRNEDSEVVHEITIFLETISWRGPYSKGTKEDKESFGLDLLFPRLMPLVHPSRSQTQLCNIMKSLHIFCDNGDWVKFAEKSKSFLQDSHAVDVQAAILLEEAIAFLYQDNQKNAEATALKALKMVSKAENHQLLAGRAYYYLANVYRREKKLGEAMRCIDLSKQNLQHMEACLDQSFMAYEEGNVMLDFISSGSVLKQKLVLLAKQCYERSLDLRRHLDDAHSTAFPHSHSFALVKIAMLLLDCGTMSGRERTASSKHIEEAKRFLDGLRRRGLEGVTVRRQIQFLLACSDLQYRLSNYETAFYVAHQALTKAEEWGFSLEAVPARERLNHICLLLKAI